MEKSYMLAILPRPRGRGNLRHWEGFRFITHVPQNEIEDFMLTIFHNDYYFIDEDDLIEGKEFPHHHYLKFDPKFPIFWQDVEIITESNSTSYVIKINSI